MKSTRIFIGKNLADENMALAIVEFAQGTDCKVEPIFFRRGFWCLARSSSNETVPGKGRGGAEEGVACIEVEYNKEVNGAHSFRLLETFVALQQ